MGKVRLHTRNSIIVIATNLPRVQVEYFGGVCTGSRHEARWVHFALYDAPLPDDGHAVLHTVDALRDLGEVVPAQGLLLRRERAVVTPAALKVVAVEKMVTDHVVHDKIGFNILECRENCMSLITLTPRSTCS